MAKSVKARKLDAHIFEKDARGHYVDEEWCSRRMLEMLWSPKEVKTIYDPAVGWGRVTDSAHKLGFKVLGSDIIDRRRHGLGKKFIKRDFLNEEFVVPASCAIMCNPPFDHVEDFCVKACSLVDQVAMIFLVRRLPAAGRWLCDLPLSQIWFMTPRPSMPTGEFIRRVERGECNNSRSALLKVGGGTQDFCWLIFDKRRFGDAKVLWLYRDA